MKFTLSWLRDHLDTAADLQTITDKLTAIGLEVESIHDPASALKDFIVAEIREASPHPNASKLQVCKVWDGTEERQIVCGAANARAGLKVVLAREGVFIPGSGITIKKTKIRDVESNGMLCSAEELKLEEASEGIIELPQDAQPGSPASAALGANDPVIEINITPNRADALGVYGIARDLAATGIGTLKPLPASPELKPGNSGVSLVTPACPYFIGCRIAGVKNGPSPLWLQQRLKAIGLRPISALVDITNYFTFAYGRPLHVFDAAKLEGGITVRDARDGETLQALNGVEYSLKPGMTVIADEKKALALGGIIGGEESGVSDETTDVFLEVAYFEPVNIATTGRALEIISDARYRFERGVDAGFMVTATQLATAMITELCGGTPGEMIVAGAEPEWKRTIVFQPSLVSTLGGVEVSEVDCKHMLERLGFEVKLPGGEWDVIPPSYRCDVEGAADLVEEILRIKGYDAIPVTPLPKPAAIGQSLLTPLQKRVNSARQVLASRGMLECCTWSFLPRAQAEAFGGGAKELMLQNPISADLDCMRPSLLPNLLDATKRNAARGVDSLSLFEAGLQFAGVQPEQQKYVAAGIRAGERADGTTYGASIYHPRHREPDAFDAKADALALLASMEVNTDNLSVIRNAPAWYHPGRSGSLMQGKNTLAHFGEIHPAISAMFDLDSRVSGFEVFLEAVPFPRAKSSARKGLSVSPYPAVERDFAFTVQQEITAAEIIKTLAGADKQLVTSVRLFDVYSGKGMAEGEKSVAVKVTLQSMERTLTEADITAVSQAVIIAAEKGFGGVLRQ